MENVDHVESVAETADRTLRVRFVRNSSDNAKAPKYNAVLWLPEPLTDATMPFAIFQDAKDGSYSVSVPGSKGFPALRPANLTHADGSLLADISPAGRATVENLRQAIFAAFLDYRRTGDAEQVISV